MASLLLPENRLGRLKAEDPRDRLFLLSAEPRSQSVVARRNQLWPYFDAPFDQGYEGTCVGHGWKSWCVCAPVIQSDVGEFPSPVQIYDMCMPIDEWTQNDQGDRQFGTSVRAGAKVMKALGFLEAYGWAWDLTTAINWLAGIDAEGRFVGGPVVIGVNWYGGMFDTNAEGFLTISGQVEGGHCVCLLGWNEKRGFAYGINSWGSSWGNRGRFYMSGETLDRLIREDGEVCTALEVRVG